MNELAEVRLVAMRAEASEYTLRGHDWNILANAPSTSAPEAPGAYRPPSSGSRATRAGALTSGADAHREAVAAESLALRRTRNLRWEGARGERAARDGGLPPGGQYGGGLPFAGSTPGTHGALSGDWSNRPYFFLLASAPGVLNMTRARTFMYPAGGKKLRGLHCFSAPGPLSQPGQTTNHNGAAKHSRWTGL